MYKILITNDDSYLSPGLYMLYEAVKDLGDVIVFSTMLPRSALGHVISFNKPLRIFKTKYGDYEVYVTDGTPVDVIHLAINVLNFKPDLVLSGVNVGENLSLQHTFYSGTLAAAIEAAILNIPAIAFSADVPFFDDLRNERLVRIVKEVARTLSNYVLKHGLPRGVDLISVNIPSMNIFKGCIKLTKLARLKWIAKFEKRVDTRGRPYYWLQTIDVEAPKGTDVYVVTNEGCVAITPINIDINAYQRSKDELIRLINELSYRLGTIDL